MMREQSRRHHVADDRTGRRRVGSQAGVGKLPRLQQSIEPKREQAKRGQIHRERNADSRTLRVYAITGHTVHTYLPPR